MRAFMQANKPSIIVALVTSIIFVYFLQPILEFVGTSFLRISVKLGSAYLDEVYAQASHLELRDYAFMLFSIPIISVGMMSALLAFMVWWSPQKRRKEKSQDKEKSKGIRKATVRKKLFVTVYAASILLVTLITISTTFFQLSLISSFKQHIRILEPYLNEQEEEILISKWSLISDERDFLSLREEIEQIAKKNKIALPENRLYSWNSI